MKKWILATRPWSFPVSIIPVVATTLYFLFLGNDINWTNAILALVGNVLFHTTSNLHSGYYDYKLKIDNENAYYESTLVDNVLDLKSYKIETALFLVASVAVGLLLTYLSDWRLLVIGGVGMLLLLTYTLSKFYALGDLYIFICFSVLPMLGTSLVITGDIQWSSLLLSVPIGFITVAVLHANNLRDIPTDREAKIFSFAMFLGEKKSIYVYITEVITPLIYVVVFVILGWFPIWSLLALLVTPIAVNNSKVMLSYRDEKKNINNLDELTAKYQLMFGTLFSISFLLGYYF